MTHRRLRLTAAQLAVAVLVAAIALPLPAAARSNDRATPPAAQGSMASAVRRDIGAQAVPDPAPGEISLTGVLRIAVADDFAGRVATTYAWLDTDEGTVTLRLTGRDAERYAGSKVTVLGTRQPDGSVSAAAGRVYYRGPGPDASRTSGSDAVSRATAATETRTVAVIVARYSDQSGYPVTLAQAADTFTNDASASVKNYWETTTRGRVTTTTTVYGQWNLGIAQCPGGNTAWNFQATVNAATSAATAHGVNLASFDHVIVWTKQPCGQVFLGVGQLPGRWVQMVADWAVYPGDEPALSAMVAAHEMGHNIGLYHSQGLVCVDGSNNQVPLSGNCASAPYYDEYTTMGMIGAPDHALLDADRLQSEGWLDSGEWQTVSAVGSYTVVPTYSTSAGVRLLRIGRPATVVTGGQTGAWTIEIRSSLAGATWDQFTAVPPWYPDLPEATTGVSIRYSEDQFRGYGSLGYSYLVDTSADGTGSSFDFFDAPLQAGETFADTSGGFTIHVDSVTGSGATVTIGDTMAPTVPLSLEGVAIPAGGAQLTWQPASDNLGLDTYQIFRGAVLVGEVPASTLTFTDPPAGIGGTVHYSVRAVDTARNPGPSAGVDVTLTSPPGPPTAVTATAGNAAALVSWTAPAPNGAPAPTSYAATSSPGGFSCSVAAPSTSCVVDGLANGTSYTFTVVATNTAGDGPASDPSNGVTPSGLLPGRPTNVVGIPGEGAASVSWDPPADQGGSSITGYTIVGQPGDHLCTTIAPTTNCVFFGLDNGTAYTFTVSATNSDGTGVPSEPSAPVTPRTRPDPPQNVAALGLNGAARVSWEAGWDGGSPITSYQVTSSPGGHSCSTAGAHTCTVTGLTNRTWYTFTVTATNVAGTSDPSAASPQAMPLAGATWVPLTPNRIVDSRKPLGVSGTLVHNVPAQFTVIDQSSDPDLNVPSNAVAVTGNLTVTRATFKGYVALTPLRPDPAPTTSTINFLAKTNVANGVTVPLGPGGTLWVTYEAIAGAKVDVIFDVTGYYTAD